MTAETADSACAVLVDRRNWKTAKTADSACAVDHRNSMTAETADSACAVPVVDRRNWMPAKTAHSAQHTNIDKALILSAVVRRNQISFRMRQNASTRAVENPRLENGAPKAVSYRRLFARNCSFFSCPICCAIFQCCIFHRPSTAISELQHQVCVSQGEGASVRPGIQCFGTPCTLTPSDRERPNLA